MTSSSNSFTSFTSSTFSSSFTTFFLTSSFATFISGLSLKDYLIYDHCSNIYNKYAGYMSKVKHMSQHIISDVVKEFNTSDLFMKRELLIQLLLDDTNFEHNHLAYLLYDLLSNDVNGNDQEILFESFPWHIKKQFLKPATYFKNALLIETNKIPFEQQIYLLKTTDLVKEKAFTNLKEIKNERNNSPLMGKQIIWNHIWQRPIPQSHLQRHTGAKRSLCQVFSGF